MKDFGGHTIKISLDDEDDWIAELIKFPLVIAFGSTPEDALAELRIVWESYVIACERRGEAVPVSDEEE